MVVNDFNRTASLDHEKGKKGATAGKEFRKEEARRFFPFFDTKIGRPSRVESREMRRIVRIRLDLSSVIRGTRTYVSRARNGGFITRRRGEVSIPFRQI